MGKGSLLGCRTPSLQAFERFVFLTLNPIQAFLGARIPAPNLITTALAHMLIHLGSLTTPQLSCLVGHPLGSDLRVSPAYLHNHGAALPPPMQPTFQTVAGPAYAQVARQQFTRS
jgi:hypothetical protein